MEILRVDAVRPDPGVVRRAVRVLRAGGLVAFPTETVYGLGAHALDAVAVERIFRAKERPSLNPLICHSTSADEARRLASAWPEAAARLASRFWPGPLTLVVPRDAAVPAAVAAGLQTVALRVPAHPVALALLREAGIPIAAPSANLFTHVSPTTAAHVARGLGDRVDLILDGGPTPVGIESTVVDVTGPRPVLLRPGTVSRWDIEALVGPLDAAPVVHDEDARASPGMVGRHYSPRAELRVYPPAERERMRADAVAAGREGIRRGALLLEPLAVEIEHPVPMPSRPAEYARDLYAALHRLDGLGCDLILADAVPQDPAWDGVRDRLARAAFRG